MQKITQNTQPMPFLIVAVLRDRLLLFFLGQVLAFASEKPHVQLWRRRSLSQQRKFANTSEHAYTSFDRSRSWHKNNSEAYSLVVVGNTN